MPVTTSQQITNYFRDFAETEVTFTKEVIAATRLEPARVHVKCLGDQWPCVIYSSSMTSAKIITNREPRLNETLEKSNSVVSLRYCFRESDKTQPITFFVKGKTTGFDPYGNEKPNLCLATIVFSQRPPDDLIFVLGRLLEAKQNSKRRSEWRLPMSAVVIKKLGIVSDGTSVLTENVRKKAVLRDLSFSGCKAIVATAPDDMTGKTVQLSLTFQDPQELFEIPADARRSDPVEGHEGICVSGFQFDSDHIPMAYKLRINSAIREQRTESGD